MAVMAAMLPLILLLEDRVAHDLTGHAADLLAVAFCEVLFVERGNRNISSTVPLRPTPLLPLWPEIPFCDAG